METNLILMRGMPLFRCKRKAALIGYIVLLLLPLFLAAQTDTSVKRSPSGARSILKDTFDGKLDFSRFLIDSKGFLLAPYIITEPALGGFGLVLAPVFLTPKKRPPGYQGYIPPDISVGIGMYTANKSWMAGAFHLGSVPAKGIKYRVGAAVSDLYLSFYRDVADKGEKQFDFSFKTVPVFLSFSKKILKQEVYLGFQYLFAKNKLTALFSDSLPETIKSHTFESTIGSLGAFVDWDRRDNFFTADRGYRFNILYSMNADWTGSDFTFQKLSGFLTWFVPFQKAWIGGFRAESNFAFGDPPFYSLPSLNLRGVPALRYQGNSTYLVETEQRYDLNRRWSALAFAGAGKALQTDQNFGEATTAWNLGGGFRYLIARVFGIRAGIDIAKGPDSFGWYIVFGHNWNR